MYQKNLYSRVFSISSQRVDKQLGTYVEATFTKGDIYNICQLCRDLNLRRPFLPPEGSLHLAMINTGTTVPVDAGIYKNPITIKSSEMSVSKQKRANGMLRVTLNLKSPELIEHISKLRNDMGLGTVLDVTPHVSLSYSENPDYKFPTSNVALRPLTIVGHKVWSSNYYDDNYAEVKRDRLMSQLESGLARRRANIRNQ